MERRPVAWYAHRMCRALAIAVLLSLATPLHAEPAPAAQLARMKAWLEPPRPSSRILQITVRKPSGTVARWTAGHARTAIAGGTWALTVLLEPKELRGAALLVRAQPGKPDTQWLYLPDQRRVEQVSPADALAPLLDSELSRGDLGFVDLDRRTVTVLGSETLDGVQAEKLQETLADHGRVTRVVTWIATADGRPLKREWYDASDRLWKVVTYENVASIHGVPTAQRVRVENAQSGGGSEYRATRIAYDVPVPKELFDPTQLAKAADHPLWSQ